MASPVCQKPPALPGIPRTARRPQHYSTVVPVSPSAAQQPDPFPCQSLSHSLLIFPHSVSPTAPFFRTVFEDVAVFTSSTPASLAGTSAEQAVGRTPVTEDNESAENSVNFSSSSLSDFGMSSSSDNDEDDTSSSSTSLQSAFESRAGHEGPLDSLSSLCAALPIKRGLSRYFSGKSQSFSSLACVTSVEELAKPYNPYAKRRRTARLGAASVLKHHSYPPRCPPASSGISKRLATCNRYKSYKSNACSDDASAEGLAKSFSLPEF